jgi:hypothetical protein
MDFCSAPIGVDNYSPSQIEAIKCQVLNDSIYYTTIPVLVSSLLLWGILQRMHN